MWNAIRPCPNLALIDEGEGGEESCGVGYLQTIMRECAAPRVTTSDHE